MKEKIDQIKPMSIRLPKDLWRFLKDLSSDNEMPMNEIIISLISKYKKNIKEGLTKGDILV